MAKKDTTSTTAPTTKKTECPVTRKQFLSEAPPAIGVTVNGQTIAAGRKEFSTGSLGYFANEKSVLMVDGVPVKIQVQVTVTVVGSKDLPK